MPPSSSELPPDAFERLHPEVQRWIWDKGWTSLRDIQAQAIAAILQSNRDVLVIASTASGKTEAAFMPILSGIAAQPDAGIQAIYVGPLKALINDQFERLETLCERLSLPVTKWHGDASASGKQRAKSKPAGILLITPESLEALFLRQPELLGPMFGTLKFIVIDELHAFLDSERGVQLASLLNRLEQATSHRARRIGLSATIGDKTMAANWLRPGDAQAVAVIESQATAAMLQLQIRGITEGAEPAAQDDSQGDGVQDMSALDQIAAHLFKTLRAKGNHLIFAGSRANTESLADKLRCLCEGASLPNEFFPHHGNLSRETREFVENRLKQGELPTTAVATTTLELGIDIGSVESVAQVGAPASIASLRQRLGRSGRREGKAAVLRIYVSEDALTSQSSLQDRLRIDTIQAVAAVRLLLGKWIEPPQADKLHLSTCLHQTLAIILQKGGAQPDAIYRILTGKGPFSAVTPEMFARLLRAMHEGEHKLIEQGPDHTLMLGRQGEKLTSFYDFYSVFVTYDEVSIVAGNKTLGTLSVGNALGPGDFLIFAGQRWKVQQVDDTAKCIFVEKAPAGRVPKFQGDPAPLHDRLAQEMRAVYLDNDVPIYLDSTAKAQLAEGRTEFRSLGLDRRDWALQGGRLYIFPWVGTNLLDTLRLALRYCGFVVDQNRISITIAIPGGPSPIQDAIRQLGRAAPPAEALALLSATLRLAKYDNLLPDDLLREAFAHNQLDLAALMALCRKLSGADEPIAHDT